MLSIIIPTYNEAKNIKVLVDKIRNSVKKDYEIIVVDDDSPDETWKIAESLKNTRVIRRINEKGLSSAVIKGIEYARGNIICVMDADLSHPSELINDMLKLINQGYDLVIGSRLIKGARIESWPLYRKALSFIATLLARPLTHVRDPLSGFFMFKKGILGSAEGMNSAKGKRKIVPRGYKILLEILVKANVKKNKIKEVPYTFSNREVGESKISLKVMGQYIIQLLHLYKVRFLS